MSHEANDNLLDSVRETIDYANELSELWTGTTVGSVIDAQKDSLVNAVEDNNLEQARLNMISLVETCRMIEKEFENGK